MLRKKCQCNIISKENSKLREKCQSLELELQQSYQKFLNLHQVIKNMGSMLNARKEMLVENRANYEEEENDEFDRSLILER